MRRVVPLLAAGALLAAAAPAAAHVDVLPRTVAEGEATELVVRVPSERDLATTRVRVEVPDEITVFSLAEPSAGWSVAPVEGPDGRIRAVVWAGGRIPAGRYADFRMLGTPFADGDVLWRALQTYADGQVKPWTEPVTGDEDAVETGPTDPGPGSPMTILAEGEDAAAGAAPPADGDDDSGAAIWLGVIAIAIAALAALGVGLLWSTRPARLPGDGEPPA